ncbi:AraC family transcriptional regulator [Paenibacillus tepidiphilus]|uniref:AraC family transcriptional regulator n=1 Tax=Paenibacillus tepidiphilus TaxID=2608683 RepID=UPI0013A55D38|nr:AraC family transcriptional regulator [Paenibacillus tepidiphilus]
MGYVELLQRTVDYIEEHLNEPITLEDCARISGFSRFHFHRLFGIHLNLSLMEYVRKRRLAHAMLDIVEGKRVLDVALEYGYSSERSFSRAFMQEFGQLPSCARQARYSLPPKPMLGEPVFPGAGHGGGSMLDYLSEVSITALGDMRVASAFRVSAEPEDEVVRFVEHWVKARGTGKEARRFGFDVPVSEEQQENGLRGYEYWVETDAPLSSLDEGMAVKEIEGCKYASLRITDPFADPFVRIPLGWRQLAGWVNSRGYQASCDQERYWLEEVLECGDGTVMELYFPIE